MGLMQKPRCDSVIAYTPIDDEPNPLILGFPRPSYVVPAMGDADIGAALRTARHAVHGEVCVLVPGRAFDNTGTRHGRGGGWYDRFLSRAPREWITVGVTNPERFSDSPLPRAEHDVPMDWIAIVRGSEVEWLKV